MIFLKAEIWGISKPLLVHHPNITGKNFSRMLLVTFMAVKRIWALQPIRMHLREKGLPKYPRLTNLSKFQVWSLWVPSWKLSQNINKFYLRYFQQILFYYSHRDKQLLRKHLSWESNYSFLWRSPFCLWWSPQDINKSG